MRRNFFAGVDGGMSGGPSVRRPGSEDPHRLCQGFDVCGYIKVIPNISYHISYIINYPLFKLIKSNYIIIGSLFGLTCVNLELSICVND